MAKDHSTHALCVTVRAVPASTDVPALESLLRFLQERFPLAENKPYLASLLPRGQHPRDLSPAAVLVAGRRLFALCLLPPMLEHMGYETASLRLLRDEYGRPYVADPSGHTPVDFNLSHSDGYVACACVPAPYRVGVDVETCMEPPRADKIARRFFTAGEQALLAGGLAEPTRIWTGKEAISKYIGTGEPHRFDASVTPKGARLLSFCLPDERTPLSLCVSSSLEAPPQWICDSLVPCPL